MANRQSASEILYEWCLEHHIVWPDSAAERFDKYIALLLKYQRQTNLTGYHDAESLARQALIDSLQILRAGACIGPAVDIGTGAGLPAIPIKIIHPEWPVTMVEPRTKRYAFLRLAEQHLALSACDIQKCRVENAVLPKHPGLIVSKAFAPPAEWLTLAVGWADENTRIACYTSAENWEQVKRMHILSENGLEIVGCVEEKDKYYILLKKAQSVGKEAARAYFEANLPHDIGSGSDEV